MVLVDGQGISLGVIVHSASPAEITLAEETRSTVRVAGRRGHPRHNPRRLIADKGYDGDRFRIELAARSVEQIAPHRRTRKYDHH